MADIQREPFPASPMDTSDPDVARGVLISTLSSPGAMDLIRQLDSRRYMSTWIPELEALKGVQQPKEHYWDVYEHSLQTVAALEAVVLDALPHWGDADVRPYLMESADEECSRLILLKLSALLHDIAKPRTKTFEPGGRMRFFGHAEIGAKTAQKIMSRLAFSHTARNMVALMVMHHLRPGQITGRSETPTERAVYRFFRDTAGVGIETLLLNLADHKAMRGPLLLDAEWQKHIDRTKSIIAQHLAKQRTRKPAKLIDGYDLMSEFGLKPGPLIGKLLSAVKEAQVRGDIDSREQALTVVRRALADQGNSP